MSSHVAGAALAAFDVPAIPARGKGGVGAVIGGEHNDGVLELADVVDLLDDLSHDLVEILHHGDEVGFARSFVFGLLVGFVGAGAVADGVRRGNEWIVNQDRRIVDKEGFVFVTLDKIAEKVGHEVRAVFLMIVFLAEVLSILFEWRAPETFATSFATFLGRDLPETVFIESRFDRTGNILVAFGIVIETVELPLPGDGGFVAGVFHHVSKGTFGRIEVSEVGVVPEVVFSGHDFDPRSGADWSGVTMVEADTVGGKGIAVGFKKHTKFYNQPTKHLEDFVLKVKGCSESESLTGKRIIGKFSWCDFCSSLAKKDNQYLIQNKGATKI